MSSIQCNINSVWLKKPYMNSRFPRFLCPSVLSASTTPKNEKSCFTEAAIEEVKENTRKELKRLYSFQPVEGMKLIDNLQWLGIGYHFADDIDSSLEKLRDWDSCGEDDLGATALRFRLLRQHMKPISCDIFEKFLKDQNIRKSLIKDKEGLLNIYEASYLAANDEDILSEAMGFAETQLKLSVETMRPDSGFSRRISRALELPRHRSMVRLEQRLGIEEYGMQMNHTASRLLQLASLDYNNVQLLHQMELAQLTMWWKQLGLADELGFARNSMAECFLWTVGLFPHPKYSDVRVETAKVIAILLVIDDVFDKYGTINDLSLFTLAIQRWDVDAIETLPEYMKVCYMALYNTTKEIAHKVLKEHGTDIHHFLARSWIDTVEAYMIEFKWFSRGEEPTISVEDYVENGAATAGAYMALVHAFFLMGEGLTNHNIKLMSSKPYPKLFSASGRILRLWDDLGTSKEEQDRGDNASIIGVLMKEKSLSTENEARQHIKQLILNLWKDLNGNLLDSNSLPLSIINVCFNMCRTAQVFYQHQEYNYVSNVKEIVDVIFREPIEL